MFNRIVFFWKIGCLGALLGLANWYVYKEALPAAVSYAALIPFLVLPFCFSLAYNAIHSVPVSIAKLFSWTGGFWFIFTIYATMGLVSGSYARPQSLSHERYISPPRQAYM